MKRILIKIEEYDLVKYSKAIRKKKDIINLILYILTYILVGNYNVRKSSRFDNNYIEIIIDKQSRIFIVLESKMYSFRFPFKVVKNKQTSENVEIFYQTVNINNIWVNALSSIFTSKTIVNAMGLNEKIEEAIMEFDLQKEAATTFKNLILDMIKFETGYLRYEIDPKHHKPLHPLHHIDICYSKQATYKIKTDPLKFDDFQNILDADQKPWQIKKCKN